MSEPMNRTVLDGFLRLDCPPAVRSMLREAIAQTNSGTLPLRRKYEFDRFEVTLDSRDQSVVIEDVVDATDSGVFKLTLAEFDRALADST